LAWAAVGAAAPAHAQWLPPGTADCVAAIERAVQTAREDAEPLLLGDVCPQIAALLNDRGLTETLLATDAHYVPADAFVTLAQLAPAYDAPPATADLSLDALDAVLEEVTSTTAPPQLSLWDRALRWLNERFGRGGELDTEWLEAWLQNLSIPERWLRYLVVVLGIVLVIATAGIVVSELRAAGVFARARARAHFAGAGEPLFDGAPHALTLDDVRRAPPARQPALLLALVLARLRRTAPIAASLTHREVAAAGRALVVEPQRPAFAAVVAAAERATFGGWHPHERELQPVLDSAAAVLHSLPADGSASGSR
jgi:hypothetical protein